MEALEPARLRRALVVKLRHHGDVLLASPVPTVLARHAPGVEVDVLVYDDTRDMMTLHPAVSQVFTVGRRWRELSLAGRAAAERRLFGALRARRYDLLVHLTDHPRGAWLARLLGPAASVAPARPERWWRRSFSATFPIVGNGRRHTVETHLDALRRIGIQPAPEDRALVLEPGDEARAHVASILAEHGLAPGRFVHLHPASRWRFKCWPAASNAALADAIADRGWPVVITAAPSDAERQLVADVLARAKKSRPIDLSGRLTLKQLAALSASARLFAGVDSAPMHIAAAVGTPVVALFGPSGEVEWGPWRVSARVVTAPEFTCRPCGLDGCGGGKVSECLVNLPVARVVAALDALLAETEARRVAAP
jgi:heptosyltransferase-3